MGNGGRKERKNVRRQPAKVFIKADGLENVGWVMNLGTWQPLEAGKDKGTKEMTFPLEPSRETLRLTLASRSPKL